MCLGRAFPGCFDVAPCLRAFFADAHYASYTVAMAYMDRHGAKVRTNLIQQRLPSNDIGRVP